MNIEFTQIPDKLKYPPRHKAILSTMHSDVVAYVSSHFKNTYSYRSKVTAVMNTLSYIILNGEAMPFSWNPNAPLSLDTVDEFMCKSSLGDLFLDERKITWDIEPVEEAPVSATRAAVTKKAEAPVRDKPSVIPTPKEDLYIKPPTIPQYNKDKVWMSGWMNGEQYVIYESLPRVPTRQNEISVTTDLTYFTDDDLLRLFPNHLIRTRAACMYEHIDGIDFDEDIGLILPIEGYTREQLLNNIIQYPHIFKLTRLIEGQIVSFYTSIEVDGELRNVAEIWDDIPESAVIPRTSEFIKEYVVRRYLLERDVKGIQHKYPIFGRLDPFLTLFTTQDHYADLGFKDPIELAKQCVSSRVAYKQSRNPIIRGLRSNA